MMAHGAQEQRAKCRAIDLLAIDCRALALLRIGLGSLLLVDLGLRLRSFDAFYGEQGILPPAVARQWLGADAVLSLHLLAPAGWLQGALWILAAAAAVALILGWKTRLVTVASFLLLLSLHQRNPMILSGADNLLRYLLFWAMFLPLGRVASMDATRRRDRGLAPPLALSVGSLGIQLQVCFVYWASVAAKWNPSWVSERDAVAITLALERMTTPLARPLSELPPALLEAATVATLALEILGPAVVWLPVATARVRMATVGAFFAFHLIFLGPILRLGLFPWVAALAWTVFLPRAFWDGVREHLSSGTHSTEPSPPRVLVRERRWVDALAAFALVAMPLVWLAPRATQPAGPLAQAGTQVARSLGLHQRWAMFAESPRTDGWYVMIGHLDDGRAVDLWHGGEVDWSRPASLSATYRDAFWSKYLRLLIEPRHVHHRRLFGDYLCRSRAAPEVDASRLERIQLVYMLEHIEGHGRRRPTEPLLLWAQECGERAALRTARP